LKASAATHRWQGCKEWRSERIENDLFKYTVRYWLK